ncbi:hypothetical protein tb265_20530 [Gemmatimonadetes bacterium T265]|nr:hypothetical protein tb265_20530 [Gemmatimonadetes bacterium T265]
MTAGGPLSAFAVPVARLAALSRWAEAAGYDFEQLIRRTPSADVYLAVLRATRAYRDIVVVHHLPDIDPAALRRAVGAQVFAASAIKHPGVAPVEDVGFTSDGRLYIATARPDGSSLSEVLADDGALPARRALDLGLQLADALAAAHGLGVVHGRLTPDSVVLVPRQRGRPERAVVLGFGTAAAQDAVRLVRGVAPEEPQPFASPERAAGGPPTFRDDVFGLASVMLSMLAGGPPPVVRAAADPPQPAPADVAPKDATEVLQRARAADPTQRYASGLEFRDALRAAGDARTVRSAMVRVPPANEGASAALVRSEFPTQVATRDARALPGVHRTRARTLIAAGVTGTLAAWGAASAWNSRTPADVSSPLNATARVSRRAAVILPVPDSAVASAPPTSAPPTSAPAAAVPQAEPGPAAALATVPVTRQPRTGAGAVARGAERSGATAGATPTPRLTTGASSVAPASVAVAGVGPRDSAAPGVAPAARFPVTTTAAGDVAAGPPAARTATTAGPASANVGAADAARADAATSAAGVRAALAEYAQAIEARDLASLRRVYPGMTEEQRRAWVAFFGGVSDLHARLVVGDVTSAGGTAQARVRGTYEYQNLHPHRTERSPVSFTATLARDGSGWRVRTVE